MEWSGWSGSNEGSGMQITFHVGRIRKGANVCGFVCCGSLAHKGRVKAQLHGCGIMCVKQSDMMAAPKLTS
jgi:hypothetical protein